MTESHSHMCAYCFICIALVPASSSVRARYVHVCIACLIAYSNKLPVESLCLCCIFLEFRRIVLHALCLHNVLPTSPTFSFATEQIPLESLKLTKLCPCVFARRATYTYRGVCVVRDVWNWLCLPCYCNPNVSTVLTLLFKSGAYINVASN